MEGLQGQAILLDLRRELLAAALGLSQIPQPRFHLGRKAAGGLLQALEGLQVRIALLLQGSQGDPLLGEQSLLALEIRLQGLPALLDLGEPPVDLEATNVNRLDFTLCRGDPCGGFPLLGQQSLPVEADHAHALLNPLQLVFVTLDVFLFALQLQLRLADRVAACLPVLFHRRGPVGQCDASLRLVPDLSFEAACVLFQVGDFPLATQQAALRRDSPAAPVRTP